VPADPNSAPRPFDVKTVEHLISLMAAHDLSEISLAEGEHRIRLRKGGLVVSSAPVPTIGPTPATTAAPNSTPADPPKPARNLLEIKSPMVGTFYSKPSPDKPDYVTVGSKVGPATVVCKLEAMKIFNDLTADVAGTVAEVCVQNAQAVDYGTVLFRVDPS
jgi:acetyl-CoA carboxylase biotin carboxyl carrier protein